MPDRAAGLALPGRAVGTHSEGLTAGHGNDRARGVGSFLTGQVHVGSGKLGGLARTFQGSVGAKPLDFVLREPSGRNQRSPDGTRSDSIA